MSEKKRIPERKRKKNNTKCTPLSSPMAASEERLKVSMA
jgi:hypothetical protein